MNEEKRLKELRKKLISMAQKVYKGPWIVGKFSQNERANELINNLGESPHLFVLGCILGRRFHDERAWKPWPTWRRGSAPSRSGNCPASP